MKQKRELGDAILVCLRDTSHDERTRVLSTFSHGELAQLGHHASLHRVVPYMAAAIRTSGLDVDQSVHASLERTHATWTAHHLLALADLAALGAVLDDAGVAFLVLKGPVLAERLYASPDLRMYEDVDVLVSPRDFTDVVQLLQGSGLDVLERNWVLTRDEKRGQLHLTLGGGTLADIHWNVLNRERVRRGFAISTDDLFERARTVDLGGLQVRTLCREDTLLHLCAHASLSGGDHLIWMKDIERAIAIEPPNWDVVVDRARSWHAGPTVAIALARSSRTLGAAVPDDVLDLLFGGRTRRSLSRWVDRRWPVERSVGNVTPSDLWAQTARATWPATLRVLAGRGARAARGLVGRGEEPGAILMDAGTEADREAYLRAVRREIDAQ